MDLQLESKRLLVVDDIDHSRRIIVNFLEEMGARRISTASNGLEGLQYLRSTPGIDLVICDFSMPKMNGLELLKEIRSGNAEVPRSLPFAMITGFSDRALVDNALLLDVDTFLIKPISFATIEQRIDSIIRSSDRVMRPSEYYLSTPVSKVSASGSLKHMGLHEKVNQQLSLLELAPAIIERSRRDDIPNLTENIEQLKRGLKDEDVETFIQALNKFVSKGLLRIEVLSEALSYRGVNRALVTPNQVASLDSDSPSSSVPSSGVFLPLSRVPAGTILYEDLKTLSGSAFLSAGTEISAQILCVLSCLSKAGVIDFQVDGEEVGIFVLLTESSVQDPTPMLVNTQRRTTAGDSCNIPVTDLEDGDIIADDVYTKNGLLFISNGTPITGSMKSILLDLHSLDRISDTVWIKN